VLAADIRGRAVNVSGGAAPTKYKTAAQSFIATSTYADVTATSGNLAAAVAAGRTYRVRIRMYLSALGTAGSGGLKVQLTGPAAPTKVFAIGRASWTFVSGGADYPSSELVSFATAFSSTILTEPNVNTTVASGLQAGGVSPEVVEIEAVIVNGVNAGTITLQAAQETGAGTTTIEHADFVCEEIG
jgi:hypothetical protein